MNINIRKANKQDLTDILSLVRELAVFEEAPTEVTCKIEEYESCFEQGIFDCLVAEYEGKIEGLALFYFAFSTWKGKMLFLEDFVVSQSRRGSGIGKLLFDALLVEAKSKNCKLVKWQVLDWNKKAQNFYSKYGAQNERNWWNGKIFI